LTTLLPIPKLAELPFELDITKAAQRIDIRLLTSLI
jgi:dethiobiotin synthetase